MTYSSGLKSAVSKESFGEYWNNLPTWLAFPLAFMGISLLTFLAPIFNYYPTIWGVLLAETIGVGSCVLLVVIWYYLWTSVGYNPKSLKKETAIPPTTKVVGILAEQL